MLTNTNPNPKKTGRIYLFRKKYNVSGHSAVSQKSVVDQTETLLQKPFPLFSEEVNAHLEQLNETVYYNDPVLVAFTLTTDLPEKHDHRTNRTLRIPPMIGMQKGMDAR